MGREGRNYWEAHISQEFGLTLKLAEVPRFSSRTVCLYRYQS